MNPLTTDSTRNILDITVLEKVQIVNSERNRILDERTNIRKAVSSLDKYRTKGCDELCISNPDRRSPL